MKRKPFVCHWLGTLAVLGCSWVIQATEPTPDEAALNRAFVRLRTYDWAQSRAALEPLDEAINASFRDSSLRHRLETDLADLLATNAPTAAKVFACERLSRIASAQSVPALAALLRNPELSHMARYALVRISDPSASEALRRALPDTASKLKVGIINSLGLIEDKASVGPLTQLLKDPAPDIAAAAASALGCIATVEATQALEEFRKSAPKDLQDAATAAWLVAAERLIAKDERREAAGIFRQLYKAENPAPLRLASFRGLITAAPNGAVDLLSQALAGNDDPVRSLAARLIAEVLQVPSLKPFLESFKAYPPGGQIAVLDAMRWRQTPEGRTVALEALQSRDPQVRIAALRALAIIGTSPDIPVLVQRSVAGPDEEREAARAALTLLPGKDVILDLVAALKTASPEGHVELLRVLAARRAVEANQVIVESLADPNESVRSTALEALAVVGGKDQVRPILSFLEAAPSEQAREQGEKTLNAIVRRGGPACTDDLLTGLKGTGTESQVVILRALGIADGPKALEAVRAIVNEKDSPLRGTAFRVLTEWSSPEAAPDLLRLAQAPANPTWGVLAFRGYVRLCRETQTTVADKKRMLTEAMAVAKDPEQKRLVISALGELRDPTVLTVLNPCLTDADLAEETCLAIVQVAANSDGKAKDQLVPALQQVVKSSKNPDVRKEAERNLERLGMKPD